MLTEVVFRRVRIIAKSDYDLRHVRLFAWNNSGTTRRILMEFDKWVFFENLLRKFRFH